MIEELIKRNRSYRRFDEKNRFSRSFLTGLVDLARLSPSARNQQALKFMIITGQDECDLLFPSLAWAGYIPDWKGPVPGERPSGYIIIVGDNNLGQSFSVDLGISAQSILLGAVEAGYGGCMIGSINRKDVRREFSLGDHYEILLVLALGKPVEEVVVESIVEGSIKYWRDANGVHHVPKRDLHDIII